MKVFCKVTLVKNHLLSNGHSSVGSGNFLVSHSHAIIISCHNYSNCNVCDMLFSIGNVVSERFDRCFRNDRTPLRLKVPLALAIAEDPQT